MKSIQLPDGSWEGMWGICFTYGTWFGVEGLVDAGCSSRDDCIQRACQFLINTQQEDGGWGETFMSCVTRKYVHHPTSQVVNTAWAVLTLLKGGYKDQAAIRRGVDLLLRRRLPDGNWVQESICGVFNKVGRQACRKEKAKKYNERGRTPLLCTRVLADQSAFFCPLYQNCMINYSNFKNIFPIWALGRYRETYPKDNSLPR